METLKNIEEVPSNYKIFGSFSYFLLKLKLDNYIYRVTKDIFVLLSNKLFHDTADVSIKEFSSLKFSCLIRFIL